jgi:hypothetical protein
MENIRICFRLEKQMWSLLPNSYRWIILALTTVALRLHWAFKYNVGPARRMHRERLGSSGCKNGMQNRKILSYFKYSLKICNVCKKGNILARSRNVYTSSAIVTAWYPFTQRERFCSDLMSPVIIKYTYVFVQSSRYFCPILIKFGFSRQEFRPQYKISRKYV